MKFFILIITWIGFSGSTSLNGFEESDINLKRVKKEIASQFNNHDCMLNLISLPENRSFLNPVNGLFYRLAEKGHTIGYLYAGRVNSCGKNGCNVGQLPASGETAEFFDYFIVFSNTKIVLSVVVYNYAASHGQEITARGWLRQFTGFNGSRNLVVGKNIDSISGATVSVNAITSDVTEKTRLLSQLN